MADININIMCIFASKQIINNHYMKNQVLFTILMLLPLVAMANVVKKQ